MREAEGIGGERRSRRKTEGAGCGREPGHLEPPEAGGGRRHSLLDLQREPSPGHSLILGSLVSVAVRGQILMSLSPPFVVISPSSCWEQRARAVLCLIRAASGSGVPIKLHVSLHSRVGS